MKTKKCNTCGKEKPLAEFHKNNRAKDGHLSTCKQCVSTYQRNRYAANSKTLRSDRRARRAEIKAELAWYRANYPQEGKPWEK